MAVHETCQLVAKVWSMPQHISNPHTAPTTHLQYHSTPHYPLPFIMNLQWFQVDHPAEDLKHFSGCYAWSMPTGGKGVVHATVHLKSPYCPYHSSQHPVHHTNLSHPPHTYSNFRQAILKKTRDFFRVVAHEACPQSGDSVELKYIKVALLVKLMQQGQLVLEAHHHY